MADLRLEAALGAMRAVTGRNYAYLLQSFGITAEDYQLLRSNECWMANERTRVRRVLQQFAAGTLDLLGRGS